MNTKVFLSALRNLAISTHFEVSLRSYGLYYFPHMVKRLTFDRKVAKRTEKERKKERKKERQRNIGEAL